MNVTLTANTKLTRHTLIEKSICVYKSSYPPAPSAISNDPNLNHRANIKFLYFLALPVVEPLPTTMRAAIVHKPGGPEALILQDLPLPVPTSGQVLIRIRAFGLNRSEMWTRMGDSPGIEFPRILGIEATGTVASAPGGEFAPGAVVEKGVSWEMLGALPEMGHTAWGGASHLALFAARRDVVGARGIQLRRTSCGHVSETSPCFYDRNDEETSSKATSQGQRGARRDY